MSSDIDRMFKDQLDAVNAESDALDAEVRAIKEKKKDVAARRAAILLQRELAIWGVTEEQYREAKEKSMGKRAALSRVAEARSLLAKAEGRAKNKKLTEADREGHAAQAKELAAAIPRLEKDAAAMQESPSLLSLLNAARAQNLREFREAQGATAGATRTKGKAHK